MKLPDSVDDPLLLQDDTLSTYIAIAELSNSRSGDKDVVSDFVRAMQANTEAVAAVMRWAHLLFGGSACSLSDEHNLQVTDGGGKLCMAFFEYQRRLHQGLNLGETKEADKHQAHLVRNGIAALGLKQCVSSAAAPQLVQGKRKNGRNRRSLKHPRAGGPRKVASVDESPGTGDTLVEGDDAESKADHPGVPVVDYQTDGDPTALTADTKQGKTSRSKKNKKRKPSSQKPPIISPSDASEDDAGPPSAPPSPLEQGLIPVVRPPKKVIAKAWRLADPSEAEDNAKTENSSRPPRMERRNRHDTGRRELTSRPKHSRPGNIVTSRNIQGRRGTPHAPLVSARRKRDIRKATNIHTRLTRTSIHPTGLRRAKSAAVTLQIRALKRIRRESMSITIDLQGGSELVPNIRRHWLPIQPRKTLRPPSGLASKHRIGKLQRKKRTRLEFEAEFVTSGVDVSDDAGQELLGTDARKTRPLPRKLNIERSSQAVNADLDTPEVPSGTVSLGSVERLIQDAATNALALLATKVGPDEPDWTHTDEPDPDGDVLGGPDQVEENGASVPPLDPPPSGVISKPPVPAPPRIWAESRQEVCESLEYFRSYHGGVYSKNDVVKGYLLGAFSASRDLFHHEGRLIISHGGGKSESIYDARVRPRIYLTDQDQEATDRSVRALLKTHKEKRAIVLLADDKYALFPYDLAGSKYTYVVLGLYWISHAWAECQLTRDGSRHVVRWKFAFQWCEGQGDPWWIPQLKNTEATDDPLCHDSNPITPSPHRCDASRFQGSLSRRCDQCQEESPTVYRQGWMCLRPRCSAFWNINGDAPQELDYAEEFLDLIPHEFATLPDTKPTRATETSDGVTTTYACSKGWHCTKCGRLSCRFKWEHWECSNCKVYCIVKGGLRSPKEFWHQRPSREFLHSHVGKDSGIIVCRLEPVDLGSPKGFTYRQSFILPHDRGKIHLILGTPMANGDADDIFQMYQAQASTGELKLRRYPLRNHRARGALLTNYFSQNSGEPYQYVGGTGNTVPFHEAPECVRRALALIKERAGLALRSDIPFNEVLTAAYMERQKMSFHSDSEKGLGPTIASLSLGSAALMHFRQHANVDNLERPRSYALTLALRHGDILVMEGDGVQQCYEHTVVPMNFRIAATARCIGSSSS